MIRKAFPLLAALLFASAAAAASAQTTPPPNAIKRQLDKIDVSFQGAGIFNQSASGTVVSGLSAPDQGESMSVLPSDTFGLVMSINYPMKPYFGVQFNYGYGRYNDHFHGPAVYNFLPAGSNDFPVQSDVNEYTLGYLVEVPYTIDGIQPIFSAGFGPMAFKPTALGGEEMQEKARMTYFYSIGLRKAVNHHFGLMVGFRKLFFLAPDYGQNYLTILQHTTTLEPTAGFYFRY